MGGSIEYLAEALKQRLPASRALVAIDGTDGSGKSTLADQLAQHLGPRPVVVVHADDFLNPSPVRHARGRSSADGFWLDSYDYAALSANVLDPLSAAGGAWYRPSSYDRRLDAVKLAEPVFAPADAIVLVEGLFLHRDELVQRWDASIFIDVPFAETARRMAVRDGSNPDPNHETMRRYVGGQRIYFASAQPWERASLVVDNTGAEPRLIDPSRVSALLR